MTREELRKKRQEIAKNNGYSEYKSTHVNQQPVTSNETSERSNKNFGRGNIDLNNRPVVKNSDGSISTVRSMSFYDDNERKEILVPTVVNGKIVSDDEAINHYYNTGEYLGKFDTVDEANTYAERLHQQQEKYYGNQQSEQDKVKMATQNIMKQNQQNVSTWDKVQSKLASSSISQERLKNTNTLPVTNTQPITQVETKKGNPNSKLNNLAYVGKKTVAGLLGGITGLGQTVVTETASQLKKGEKESTGQAVTNLANKMLLPDSVNMIDATKETIKGNIDILKDKNKNAIQKIAGIGQNSVSGAVNTLPFKQKTNAVIQTIGSILKDKQTSNTALEVNKAISQPSQNFNQQLAEESERYGKPTQYVGEALQSVGNMIPSIAISMITGDPSARTINNGIKC